MTKELIGIVKPAKPITEMSDAERRAFADELFDLIAAKLNSCDASGHRPCLDEQEVQIGT